MALFGKKRETEETNPRATYPAIDSRLSKVEAELQDVLSQIANLEQILASAKSAAKPQAADLLPLLEKKISAALEPILKMQTSQQKIFMSLSNRQDDLEQRIEEDPLPIDWEREKFQEYDQELLRLNHKVDNIIKPEPPPKPLSPRQQKIYDLVKAEPNITGCQVAARMGLSQAYVSKQLQFIRAKGWKYGKMV